MFQLSSSVTLIYKIFVPVFWVTIAGAFTATVLFSNAFSSFVEAITWFRVGTLLSFLGSVYILYRTFWQFKRVEADANHVFVTDYFTTARYAVEDVEAIAVKRYIFSKIGVLTLKGAGVFGKIIPFWVSQRRLDLFFDTYPTLRHLLADK